MLKISIVVSILVSFKVGAQSYNHSQPHSYNAKISSVLCILS